MEPGAAGFIAGSARLTFSCTSGSEVIVKRFGLIVLLFSLTAVPARAEISRIVQAHPDSSFYQVLTSFFDRMELTARLELDAYRWVQDVPLIGGAPVKDRKLSSRLRPVTLYLGGIEAGVRFRQVRLFSWFRSNLGDGNVHLLPSGRTGIRFRSGEVLGELTGVRLHSYGVRMEYAPEVFSSLALGGGLAYRTRASSVGPVLLDSPGVGGSILYKARSKAQLLYLYVPARYRFTWGKLQGRAGITLTSRHQSLYQPQIAYYNPAPGEPPAPPGTVQKSDWEFRDANPHAWFAEAGVAVPVYGFMLHVGLHVERIRLEGAYTETIGGLRLQVGLPF